MYINLFFVLLLIIPFANSFVDDVPIIVITIQNERYKSFIERINDSVDYHINNPIIRFNGTDGHYIDRNEWINSGKLIECPNPKNRCDYLFNRRGQFGCYDSHVKVLEYIVAHNIPLALVAEDDLVLRSSKHTSLFKEWLEDFITLNVDMGYLYSKCATFKVSPHFNEAGKDMPCFQGNQGILMTQVGAIKLLREIRPYKQPYDIYYQEQIKKGNVHAVQLASSKLDVVSSLQEIKFSDTISII